ncbi:putative quinol monooxygenase [Colwellia sp. KU-HH00111]|uniref:putative quinol monooxygenase n=1 Tax=Colwellia sp. KU-HH00111 TaxID=3127652 RepID=UPI0031078F99
MSQRVYVLAQFQPKAGKEQALFNTLKALEPDSYREQGCIQYTVTRQIDHESASRNNFSIVFNEIWASAQDWAAHGRRQQIQQFFENEVTNPEGLVADVMVTAYTDEGVDFDAPVY